MSSVTKLTNRSRQKYVSYPRFVSCTLEVLLGTQYTQDEKFGSLPVILKGFSVSTSFLSKEEKVKSQSVTPTLPKLQGPEDSGALSKKRQNPKSKKTPTKKGVLIGSVIELFDPQDPKRNIQLVGTGLPSTSLDGGTRKSKPLPEGTAKTTPCLERPRRDKDSEGFKPPADMELLTNPVVDPSGNDSKYQSDQTQSAILRYRSLTENECKNYSEVDPNSETL
ncbi:hypothetical protein Tco_0494706 [Tanacetum coccineum]